VSAYIPTTVISITDGQIFLETDLIQLRRAAPVNVGLSVSRVVLRQPSRRPSRLAPPLKHGPGAVPRTAAFSRFGSDLDKVTLQAVDRGAQLTDATEQPQFQPLTVESRLRFLFAGVKTAARNDVEGLGIAAGSRMDSTRTSTRSAARDPDDMPQRRRWTTISSRAVTAAIKDYKVAFLAALKDQAGCAKKPRLRVRPRRQSRLQQLRRLSLRWRAASKLWPTYRSSAPHPQCEEHAADHQGHEDGLGGPSCAAPRTAPMRARPYARIVASVLVSMVRRTDQCDESRASSCTRCWSNAQRKTCWCS